MRKKANSAGTSRAPSQRQLRVSEEIRHALSQMVLQANFRDPELVDQGIKKFDENKTCFFFSTHIY